MSEKMGGNNGACACGRAVEGMFGSDLAEGRQW